MDKWLSHPTALKIISVILALLLWAVVHIDPETSPQTVTSNRDTKIIEASPIVPVGLDEKKYVLTAMEPTVARIVVEGRISQLFAISNDAYVVNVDLSNVREGIQELPLTLSLPKGIQKVELSPEIVTVQVVEIVTKPYDLQIITEGQPAEGYIMGTPTVMSESGNTVQVTLPKDEMSRVGVVTATIDVSGADKTVTNKRARIVVYDKDGIEMPHATAVPETVNIEVGVTLPFKQVPLQLRYTGSLAEELSIVSITPEVDQVTVYAQQQDLEQIQVYDGAVLDLAKVKESGVIKVKTPPVDGIKSVAPSEIALDIVVEQTMTRTLAGMNITINGAAEGMTVYFQTPATGKIDLQLRGAEPLLSEVKASDVRIIADVTGLAPGTHTIALEVDLPAHVQPVVSNEMPLTAVVTIEEEEDSTAVDGSEEEDLEVGGRPPDPADESTPEPTDSNEPEQQTSDNHSGSSNGGSNI